jgi:glutamate synthase (ferredoxin)
MSSEIGVLDVDPVDVIQHGRLDWKNVPCWHEWRSYHRRRWNQNAIVTKRPYRQWLNDNLLQLAKIPYTNNTTPTKTRITKHVYVFGYPLKI